MADAVPDVLVANPDPFLESDARGPAPTRRDLLTLIPLAGAGILGAGIAWSLIDLMNPAADVIAAGAPMDIDLRKVAPGQQIIVLWRGNPIAIVNRPAPALKVLQSQASVEAVERPQLRSATAPPYAQELASVDPARIRGSGRHLHASWLPSGLYAETRSDDPGAQLARRLFLSVSRLEIRSGRAGLFGRAGAVQSAGAAVSFHRTTIRSASAKIRQGRHVRPCPPSCRCRRAGRFALWRDPVGGATQRGGDPAGAT